MGIVTLDEFKDYLGGTITDAGSDLNLQRSLDASYDAITSKTGRVFEVDTADQTKLYYPTNENQLDVVDLVKITSLKTDSSGTRTYATTLTASDYELLPYNEDRWQRIRMWPTSSRAFGPGRLVQIVGRFGYAEGVDLTTNPETLGYAPHKVRLATLLLGARLYKRQEAPFGILSATDLGTYARLSAEDPDVLTLLREYMRTKHGSWVLV